MPVIQSKPLSWFKVGPQARTHFDEDELRLLGESLKVKQPRNLLRTRGGASYAAKTLLGLNGRSDGSRGYTCF